MRGIQLHPEARFAWCGSSVLVVDNGGAADTPRYGGYFFHETRHLSRLRLLVAGESPWLCAVGSASPREVQYGFVFPASKRPRDGAAPDDGEREVTDIRDGGEAGTQVDRRALDLRLAYRVRPGALEATLRIGNRSREAVEVDLDWELDADYGDYQSLFGGKGPGWETAVERREQPNGVRFRALDERLPFETRVHAGTGEWTWRDDDRRLSTRLALGAGQEFTCTLHVEPHDPDLGRLDDAANRAREARLERWHASLTRVESASGLHAEIVRRNVEDVGAFALLAGAEDEWLCPGAGIPRFPAFFARDALTAGWQGAILDRGEMLDAALTRAARLQGTVVDPARDEEPGRIVQQARPSPASRLGKNPFARYYGDQASPLMFVISLGQLYAWTGDERSIRRHWDAARRILDWAREYGDRDGDGYLEYLTRAKGGPKNQGWKDSDVAVVYEDGELVPSPIAACEVQGYWFAAQQIASVLAWVLGERDTAAELWRDAMALRERFNRDFWMPDAGFVAFGLDPQKRQIRSIASNAGHVLTTGILRDEHIPPVVGRLFAPDMYSGWGIRTLSSRHPSYNPISYHLGSVWAVENGTIAFGLRRYGFEARATEIAKAMFDLAAMYDHYRIPESLGGYDRRAGEHPSAFPMSDQPQLWNGTIFPILVQTLLGVRPVAALHLLAVDPRLPTWLPDITLRGLRVGEATVSLRFRRDEHGVTQMDVLERRGPLHIVRQPPVDDLHVGLWDRLGALVRGVAPSWASSAVP